MGIESDNDGRRSAIALAGLALGAAGIEAASMLPYLAGIGVLTASDLGWPGIAFVLAGYCVVMLLPALLLLGARVAARRLVEPLLLRLDVVLSRGAGEMIAWVVGILGFLIARDAATRLGLF